MEAGEDDSTVSALRLSSMVAIAIASTAISEKLQTSELTAEEIHQLLILATSFDVKSAAYQSPIAMISTKLENLKNIKQALTMPFTFRSSINQMRELLH